MSVGPSELVVILLVVFLLFGSRRLADLGKGIGDGIRGFKRGIAGETDEPSDKPKTPPAELSGKASAPSAEPTGNASEPARPAAPEKVSDTGTVAPLK